MTVAITKRLLVVVPCLNEQDTIGRLIEQVPKAIEGVDVVDVLVVDDGSKDQTVAIAQAAGAQVISHGVNRGVGTAFQSAVGYAIQHKYDFMVNIDGDLQFDPADIPKIFWPVCNGVADMVTASRFVDKAFTPIMPKVKLVGNHMMSFLIRDRKSTRLNSSHNRSQV
jgi:glycosyltransferase involved in cell wall biosynthesis